MKLFIKNSLIVALALAFAFASLQSQPKNFEKAKQRIITMKKINLLEILNLSQEDSDRFLAIYTTSENKIIDISDKIDDASEELHQLLRGKSAKAADLKKNTDAILKLQDELHTAMGEKFKSVQSLLNAEEFAKFVIFERRFQDQLRQRLMKRKGGDGPGRFDDDEDRPGRGGKKR